MASVARMRAFAQREAIHLSRSKGNREASGRIFKKKLRKKFYFERVLDKFLMPIHK